jgi:hypothetical protein
VNELKCFTVFLDNCKPARSVGQVRSLINAGVDFSSDNVADLVIESRQNGHIAKYPWFVFNYWHKDWWKEVLTKATTFGIIPGKALVLEAHEMVH